MMLFSVQHWGITEALIWACAVFVLLVWVGMLKPTSFRAVLRSQYPHLSNEEINELMRSRSAKKRAKDPEP